MLAYLSQVSRFKISQYEQGFGTLEECELHRIKEIINSEEFTPPQSPRRRIEGKN